MFLEQPQQWWRVEVRQGSRTSKAGKGGDGEMILPWLMWGCVVKKVWATRLSASIPGLSLGPTRRQAQSWSELALGMHWEHWFCRLRTDCLGQVIKTGVHLEAEGVDSPGSRQPGELRIWFTSWTLAHTTYLGQQRLYFRMSTARQLVGLSRIIKITKD